VGNKKIRGDIFEQLSLKFSFVYTIIISELGLLNLIIFFFESKNKG